MVEWREQVSVQLNLEKKSAWNTAATSSKLNHDIHLIYNCFVLKCI